MSIENGAGEGQPAATDLRSLLESSFEAAETSDSAATPVENQKEGQQQPAEAAGSGRDPATGRFTAKQQAAADAAAAAGQDPAAAAAAVKEPPAADPKAAKPDSAAAAAAGAPGEAPAHWSAEDKAMVAGLPPEHRAAVVDRFKRMEAGFTPKLQRAAALERDFGEVEQMFAPHRAAMQQAGWTVPQLIKAWGDVEQQLQSGNAEGVIRNIARAYNFDLRKLGGAAPAAGQQQAQAGQQAQGEQDAYVDPEIQRLNTELANLTQRLTARERAEQERAHAEARTREEHSLNEVRRFAEAKGEDGQPSHPHYAEVELDMVALAQADVSAGRTPTLNDLYERAVWMNPAVRQKMLAAKEAAAEQRRAEEAKTRSAAAQRAGKSVTGAPGAATQAARPQGIRANLEAAWGE
jgi:hypothetical protein